MAVLTMPRVLPIAAARPPPASRARALAKKRWQRWSRRAKNGIGITQVEYDRVIIDRLVQYGYLAPDHTPADVGDAIARALRTLPPLR